MPTITDRFKNGWNAFLNNKDPTNEVNEFKMGEVSSYTRPDRVRYHRSNDRTIITSIYTRIAVDVSQVPLRHVLLDDQERYKETKKSKLNDVLNLSANVDQTGESFIQDAVMTMLEDGHVALVPTDLRVSKDPTKSEEFDVRSARVGVVKKWYPTAVDVEAYNERTGKRETIHLPKSLVCIIPNPFYAIMNEPNSILKRLTRKLAILDAIDDQSGSGKLDLIIQLPYVVKNETKRQQAEKRRREIETQLNGSKYGIAYTDGTERITQLNRSIDNNLMNQIEYLTSMLYGQLSMTEDVMKGTADEQTMLNYRVRTIKPILNAFKKEIIRKWISKTARSQGQSIMYFQNPFELVPAAQMASIADTYTRNEILSTNEVRSEIGYVPSSDPAADELRNKNLYKAEPTSSGGYDPTVDPSLYDQSDPASYQEEE